MKASLQLKMGQHLTMTPQLQQAIRLLQLSSLELQQEIQQALESNPLLELDEEQEGVDSDAREERNDNNETYEVDYDNKLQVDSSEDNSGLETSDALTQDSMPDELPVDTTWDEVYTASSNSSSGAMRDDDMPFQGETSEGLYEHLEWQKNLTPFSDNDLAIATAIIDAIDERGYLTQTCDLSLIHI